MPKPANPIAAPLLPHITVDNAAAAIDFYKRAFGAVEVARHLVPNGTKIMHAALLINGSPLMLNDDFPEFCGGKARTPRALGGSPVTLHLNVPDVDAAWTRAVKAGAEVTMPLADQFWGDRYGMLRDPFGHDWSMSTSKSKPSEGEIQRAAAKAFASAGKPTRGAKRTAARPKAVKAAMASKRRTKASAR